MVFSYGASTVYSNYRIPKVAGPAVNTGRTAAAQPVASTTSFTASAQQSSYAIPGQSTLDRFTTRPLQTSQQQNAFSSVINRAIAPARTNMASHYSTAPVLPVLSHTPASAQSLSSMPQGAQYNNKIHPGQSNAQNAGNVQYEVLIDRVLYRFGLAGETRFPVAVNTGNGLLHWVKPLSTPAAAAKVAAGAAANVVTCSVTHTSKPVSQNA